MIESNSAAPSPFHNLVWTMPARRLKRKKPGRRDIWHLDEVVITINGEKRYLWRANSKPPTISAIIMAPQSQKSATTSSRHWLN